MGEISKHDCDELELKGEIRQDSTERGGRERGLELYEIYLGFKKEELEGKDVLDLGSGETEKFERELKEAGVSANVIPLNPDYSAGSFKNKLETTPGWQGKTVAASAQEMPFKEESFDRIFALYSVTVFSHPFLHPEEAKKWMSEIARVLKPGGEARLAPAAEGPENTLEVWRGEFGDLLLDLEKQGLKCKVELVKNKEIGLTGPSAVSGKEMGENNLCARIIIEKPK